VGLTAGIDPLSDLFFADPDKLTTKLGIELASVLLRWLEGLSLSDVFEGRELCGEERFEVRDTGLARVFGTNMDGAV